MHDRRYFRWGTLRGGCTNAEYNSNRHRHHSSEQICGHDGYTYYNGVADEATTTAVLAIFTTL